MAKEYYSGGLAKSSSAGKKKSQSELPTKKDKKDSKTAKGNPRMVRKDMC